MTVIGLTFSVAAGLIHWCINSLFWKTLLRGCTHVTQYTNKGKLHHIQITYLWFSTAFGIHKIVSEVKTRAHWSAYSNAATRAREKFNIDWYPDNCLDSPWDQGHIHIKLGSKYVIYRKLGNFPWKKDIYVNCLKTLFLACKYVFYKPENGVRVTIIKISKTTHFLYFLLITQFWKNI